MDINAADRRPRVPLRRGAYICGASVHIIVSACLLAIAYRLYGARGAAVALGLIFVSGLAVPVIRDHVKFGRIFPFQRRPGIAAAGTGGGVSGEGGGGMGTTAMSALPAAFKFKRDVRAAEGWVQCSICLGVVRAGESVRQLPACGHLFHVSCIDEWLRSHPTCPLCRAAARRPDRPPV